MDCTNIINEIAKISSKILSENNVTINELDWVFARVKERICANTQVKAIVDKPTNIKVYLEDIPISKF